MRNLKNRLLDLPYRLMALGTVAAMSTIGEAAAAGAGQTIGTQATSLNEQTKSVGQLVTTGMFVGGLTMVGLGLMKLKAAADSQGREPYGPGVWRLGAGAGLAGLPLFTNIFRDSLTGGSDAGNITRGGIGY